AIEGRTKEIFRDQARNWSLTAAKMQIDFTFSGTPDVSVIVVLFNQFALTMASLASLRSVFQGKIELILVDSASTDHTLHIDRYVSGATIIRLPENEGFIRACNIGLGSVSAKALL